LKLTKRKIAETFGNLATPRTTYSAATG